jgi:AraC family transcriptional regulator, regulatory protein of adaptative response / DNA-3-methyladenine glycosylase II
MIADPTHMSFDADACYRAFKARDARFDGRFYIGVTSTGIFCRPICPARTPKFENCTFHQSAAAAYQAGFRPCLRCRPEIAPGVAGWRGTAASVSRALGLIAEGALDGSGDITALAGRVGLGPRHLRRLFAEHVGASPVAVATVRRVLFARQLIAETSMSLAQVALASGFGSVRRFNEVMARTFKRPPSELRRPTTAGIDSSGIGLRLPYLPPFEWDAALASLSANAISGVETVEQKTYRRTVSLGEVTGSIEVSQPEPNANYLMARLNFSQVSALAPGVARLRHLFDLNADPSIINAHLSSDSLLASSIARQPGLRLLGAWDSFELGVRTLLEEHDGPEGSAHLASRLVAHFGVPAPGWVNGRSLTHLFPTPAAVAESSLQGIGLARQLAVSISSLAAAIHANPTLLNPWREPDTVVANLTTHAGIRPQMATFIAMRVAQQPDVFSDRDKTLVHDLASRRGENNSANALAARIEAWRPWRGYAAAHLQASALLIANTPEQTSP